MFSGSGRIWACINRLVYNSGAPEALGFEVFRSTETMHNKLLKAAAANLLRRLKKCINLTHNTQN